MNDKDITGINNIINVDQKQIIQTIRVSPYLTRLQLNEEKCSETLIMNRKDPRKWN